ncbi:MAG: DPP IV N-terminal domain-containing protein, partial [Ignavibacteria bacterium]|nr:DPP IV N-terminal domain-containing protein [Ignavibacteria bacterium]
FLTLIIYIVFSQTTVIQAQTKQIELKDIWSSRVFSSEMVYGINPLKDGHTYAIIEKEAINVYDYATGEFLKQLVSFEKLIPEGSDKSLSIRSYTLSEDETKILFPTETEAIYRHSTRSLYYIYDISSDKLTQLSVNGMQQLATFSPDGNNIAFVRDNNLFVKDLSSNVEQQITSDGKTNEIINGTTDWVYEEEFSFTQAFFWSDDSKKIAFYKMDESIVKEFQMTYFNELYPEEYRYKYPKAGEDNSIVSIHVWNATTNESKLMNIGNETDIYIPRIAWTRNSDELSIQRMNRLQNHLEILIANCETGNSRLLYEEKNPYYIDITDNLRFLSDNKHFLITSEKDGFNHIYLYDLSGKLVKQLTNGNFDITSLYGFSQKYKKVYFQSAETSPLDRNIYSVDLKG